MRQRKNYQLGPLATELRTPAVSHIAQFRDEHGDVVCTYDLSPFAALGPVVAEMVLAFRVVQPHLHATAETLTPYLLLLGAQMYANPVALLA